MPEQKRVKSVDMPLRTWVLKLDPDWERDKRNEPEYEFTKRTFTANRAKRGAYSS